MRTNEERVGLVRKRMAEIRREGQRRKQHLWNRISVAACLFLVVGIGSLMPGRMSGITGEEVLHTSGAASLVGSHAALGFILMGLFSFLFGVCVTVLLYRLHRRNKRARQENPNNEL